MAKVVNLRGARKARERAARRAEGDANAAKFGRTKAERQVEEARAGKERAFLDGHRLQPEIRRAEAGDADALLRVIHRALRETNAGDYPPAVIERLVTAFTGQRIAALIAGPCCHVALSAGHPVGLAALEGDRIRSVFVDPAHQGRGSGGALMRTLLSAAEAKEVPVLRLDASLSAVDFYAVLGFVATGERNFDGERTVTMEWRR
ncbi:GNAT family N-acetyltransferase [Haematobacter missouriensis]|uniref:GNAT family N-acetyltransferase n=1 Tax=Haematobacter missouriensis TaxID=366616 RepID=A0A212AYN6_9RHOB|nr:GNAT family N-acetyltransferase [Haematobacter missouriensis]OWJ86599.1 GNAT family N-acetyltransferase [Haematobacter missouriensis]